MPNVMGVLRAEIRRLARKETKEAVRDLKRQVTALRRRLASTKKRLDGVERAAQRAGSARAAAPAAAETEEGAQIRFSPRWVRVHRGRLGMSRRVYAKLVGVSPQTILLWEQGKARPRRSALASWRAIRGKGIRELKASLGEEGTSGRGRRGGRRAAGTRGASAAKRTGKRAGKKRSAAKGRGRRGRGGRARAGKSAGRSRAPRAARARGRRAKGRGVRAA
ncbi:MAG: helix-turn-helix domain-containing protein [Bacteroidota bacterium]